MAVGKNKVKVHVEDLKVAIQNRRAEVAEQARQEEAAYKEQAAGFNDRVADELEAYAKKIRTGRAKPKVTWKNIEVPTKLERLESPKRAEGVLADLDRMIKTLDMAAEDTILISADDFAHYLG